MQCHSTLVLFTFTSEISFYKRWKQESTCLMHDMKPCCSHFSKIKQLQTFALHKLFINWYKWNSIWNSQKKIHCGLVAAAFWFLQKSNVKVLEKRSSNKILRLEVELCNLGIGQRYSNTWSPTANGEMTFNNNGKISMKIAKDHFVNQETKLLSTSW